MSTDNHKCLAIDVKDDVMQHKQVSYVLEITETFTWTVRVHSKLVDISCTPLAKFPCTLRSVTLKLYT